MKRIAWTALLVAVACRPLPPAQSESARGSESDRASTSEAEVVAAIADSIRRALRDSVDLIVRDSPASITRQDSALAAARRDSIAAAARDSIAAAARRDSIAAAARADSILAAARDSIAAAARRDSLVAAARRDSIEAAAAAAAREDSIALAIAAARRDSLLREDARIDSVARARAREAAPAARARTASTDVEELRALGPAYIPYDRGPQPVWDTETQAMLTTTLLPVVRAEELTARTRTYYWMLIDAEGQVVELVLQTSSGSEAFDRAAAEAAMGLRFSPAMRGGRPVPTWIVRDISLIMQ